MAVDHYTSHVQKDGERARSYSKCRNDGFAASCLKHSVTDMAKCRMHHVCPFGHSFICQTRSFFP